MLAAPRSRNASTRGRGGRDDEISQVHDEVARTCPGAIRTPRVFFAATRFAPTAPPGATCKQDFYKTTGRARVTAGR